MQLRGWGSKRGVADTQEMLFRLSMGLVDTAFEIEGIEGDAVHEYSSVERASIRGWTAGEWVWELPNEGVAIACRKDGVVQLALVIRAVDVGFHSGSTSAYHVTKAWQG